MSKPKFPEQPRDVISRPGALNASSFPDQPRRVAALERSRRMGGTVRRIRRSLGFAPLPGATGDYIMAFANSGVTVSPYFASIGGSYPATGMWTLGALDLMAGSQNWRIRGFYEVLAGDSFNMYGYLMGANPTGAYGITSWVNVSSTGVLAEGVETGSPAFPRTVGGSGNRMYAYVTEWATRAACVSSGKSLFAPYIGTGTAVTIGWFASIGVELELTA